MAADKDAQAQEARELEDFFRGQDPVDVAAAEWHTRWEQGLAPHEAAGLQRWLAADPAHGAAFQRLEQDVAALRSISAAQRARLRAPSGAPSRPGAGGAAPGAWSALFSWRPAPALVAWCCAAVLVAGVGWHQWQQPTFTGSYAVDRAQRRTIALPDGSELVLDAATQAQVVLYRDRREVRIAEGQAMFSVAPDSAKPFHVLAGAAHVTVVGTRFSVRYRHTGMDAGVVSLAVEEGRVRVAGVPGTDGGGPPTDLVAGQGLTVSPEGVLGQLASVAPGGVALWRKGLVRFENTPLADALLELERYGPTGLVVRDPRVAAMPIGGSYQIAQPRAFARMVAQILPVRLVEVPGGKTEIVAAH